LAWPYRAGHHPGLCHVQWHYLRYSPHQCADAGNCPGGGDLTRRIQLDGNDEISETAAHFNTFLENLRRLFLDIRTEAARLTDGVHSVNQVLATMSDDFRALADQSSSNAATIEQITVSISHIADNANEADNLVKDTDQLSGESAETVAEVAQKAGQSARDVESLSTLLEELSKSSQQISGITGVIRIFPTRPICWR
jgi:methyl-accepting chemotaxis protein